VILCFTENRSSSINVDSPLKSISNFNGFLHLPNNFKDFNFLRSEVGWSRKDHVW
jgi:hypothetical protein